jgi:phosphopantetheine adenylyltransferase
LDTRTKIVGVADWIVEPGEEWVVVAGVFDPVTLEAVNAVMRHAQPGAKLAVVVAEGSQTLLGREARATLLAALREVDAILIEDVDVVIDRATRQGARATLRDERAGDPQRADDFSRFVLERQAAGIGAQAGKRSQ